MSELKLECTVRFQREGHGGRKAMREGGQTLPPAGRVPRVSRWLALAHRLQVLIAEGTIKDFAEIARLGHVSRARVTQIMNLLLLAPDIQEEILCWPPIKNGRDPFRLRDLLPIAQELYWPKQRKLWQMLNVGPT